jgi:hypothetical protein
MKVKQDLIALFAITLLFLPSIVCAAVFPVSDVTGFRNALVSATQNSEDDTINVAAGTYDLSAGALYYYLGDSGSGFGSDNHALTIQGAGTGATILDGGVTTQNLVLDTTLISDSGAHITVRGITAQNARTGPSLYVRTNAASITVRESEFKDNTSGYGAGAYLRTLTGAVTAERCIFTNNAADTGAGGGLLVDTNNTPVLLTNSIFNNNWADEDGGGAYLYTLYNTITATNNTFTNNYARDRGAGLFVSMFYDPSSRANIYNNISWGNTGASYGGRDIYVNDTDNPYTTGYPVYLYNNDFTYFITNCQTQSGCVPAIYQGSNIDVAPLLFTDSHLQPGSPCIDVGLNTAPSIPSQDIDGDNRIVNGTADMGADEYNPPVYHCVSTAGQLLTALSTAQSNSADDIIQVVKGTYTGNFFYNSSEGYGITLEGGNASGCASREVNPANTVLDGGNAGAVLILNNTDGGDISVEGFTIQNGSTPNYGGGVYAYSYTNSGTAGDVTLANNIITNNTAGWDGGGVFAYSASTLGMSGTVTLLNNIVTGNTATGNGGGVSAESYASSGTAGTFILFNNIIAGNHAGNNGGGALVDSYATTGTSGNVTLTNNTITRNDADGDGGGLTTANYNNTIDCYNNIIWGNTAVAGGDIYMFGGPAGTANDYWNDYTDRVGMWDTQVGHIDADPLFVGGGAYHLRSASPCIDAGVSAPNIPSTDFEGDARIIDGDYNGTAAVDIGADEFVPVYMILHTDGAVWDAATGWILTAPPYYPGTAYAKALERVANGSIILHKDGAIYNTATGWTLTAPPYYPGTNYAVDAAYTNDGYTIILHRDGAIWSTDTGWTTTTPPYYPSTAYAKALERRGDASYVILHKDGAIYDSASGWLLTAPPYYPGTTWAVDVKLNASGYVILHKDGALWDSASGWTLTAPPYYPTTDYARVLELVGSNGTYVILHKDGAIYNSAVGWVLTAPPYYPGTAYAVDLEVR